MKLTKEQWKQLSDRIFLTLRPTQHPVAMKFIKTPEEFDAIPDIEFCRLLLRHEQRLHGADAGVFGRRDPV